MAKYKFLIINGPNLDMLGVRNPDVYGKKNYMDLKGHIQNHAEKVSCKTIFLQSYFEGEIALVIAHSNKDIWFNDNSNSARAFEGSRGIFDGMNRMNNVRCDGIILNAGAYSHYSYAIRDAIELNDTPIAEVHISDVDAREEFRHNDVLKDVVDVYVKGLGFDSYTVAMDKLIEIIEKREKTIEV